MAEVYGALGEDVVVDAIARASDVNQIEACIVRELERRGIAYESATATAGAPITTEMRNAIHNNCVAGGYSGGEAASNILSAAQMQKYVAFIKELYPKIVVP